MTGAYLSIAYRRRAAHDTGTVTYNAQSLHPAGRHGERPDKAPLFWTLGRAAAGGTRWLLSPAHHLLLSAQLLPETVSRVAAGIACSLGPRLYAAGVPRLHRALAVSWRSWLSVRFRPAVLETQSGSVAETPAVDRLQESFALISARLNPATPAASIQRLLRCSRRDLCLAIPTSIPVGTSSARFFTRPCRWR